MGRVILMLLLGAAGLGPALAEGAAPGSLRAEIVSAGEYAATPIRRTEDAPDTASGLLNVSAANPPLLRATAEVAAFDGLMFGMVVRLPGLEPDRTVPVTVHTSYPGLRTPDGRVVHEGTYPSAIGADPKFIGYCFDRAWELVPGTWTLAVVHEGRVIASRSFTVTVGAAPDGRAPCNPAPSVS